MIESKTILVPTSLKDVKLHQMLAYESLKAEMDDTQRQLEAVSIFCELTMTEVMAMPFDILQKAVERITLMLTESPTFTPRFKMDGVEYGFIPNLDDMSVGEFIDIENYCKEKHDLWKVMSVLYRPVTHSGQNGRYEIAPYSANLVTGFKDLDCNTTFGAMVFFLEFRNRLTEFYPEVFGGGDGTADENRLTKKWGWFGMVYRLSGRNFLQLEDVYSQTIHTALYFTAYESDIAEMEQKIIKQSYKR